MTGSPTSKRFEQLVSSQVGHGNAEDETAEDSDLVSSAPAADPEAFKLRGGSYTLLVVNVTNLARPEFFSWLEEKTAQAPNFYRYAPVALDLEGLPEDAAPDFAEIVGELRKHKLVAVGVQNGTDEQSRLAAEAGLSVFPMWRAGKPLEEAPKEPETRARSQPSKGGSRLVTQPIRSGRQIYAQNGDLVVLSTASAGSELLADGNIHVYGTIRGRALAGVSGNTSARIFCDSLQAELVSVAGHWLVREDMDERLIGRPVQIYLKGDLLVIEPMR